jgi:hypothetical protein
MDTNVIVPKSLLEGIFRILDHLDRRGNRDGQHSHGSGYRQRIEHDNDLWGLWIKIKQLQAHVVDTYLLTIDDVTEDERNDLDEWLARGYSVYDNPYTIYDETGQPMDFISGCRVGLDMCQNPGDYFGDLGTEGSDYDWGDEDMPF